MKQGQGNATLFSARHHRIQLRGAIELLEKLRDHLQEESNKFQTREGQFGNGYIGYEDSAQKIHELIELLAARQAAESPGPAPEREQWANNVANLIQLGARDGESLSAELHRMEKVLLTYYPRAERSLAEVSEDENGMLPCPFCGGEAYG